jgi:hypothetical protein
MAKASESGGKSKSNSVAKPLLPLLNNVKTGVPASLKPPSQSVKYATADSARYAAQEQAAKNAKISPTNIADSTDRKQQAAQLTKAKAAQAALSKLTGGQKLNDAEKKILNIKSPAKKDTKPTTKKPTTNTKKKKVVNNTTANSGNSSGTGSSDSTDSFDDNVTGVGSVPDSPSPSVTQEDPKTYKPASPDLIMLEEEAFPVEVITDLLFEDIGGTEILNFARHDLISGIDIKYQQISNLAKIDTIYGGANLIALQNTSEQVFKKYPLGRYDFTPEITDDPSGFNSPVYLDAAGNLVVELKNIDNSYQIEIEFQSAKTNDIIY